MTIKKLCVYDLDGTVINSEHRYRTINGKIDLDHWNNNRHLAHLDTLKPLYSQYLQDLHNPEHYTVVATARVLYAPDRDYIDNVLGAPRHIISRKEGDARSGALLKVLGLRRLLSLKQFQKIKEGVFYEDNLAYLNAVCSAFPFIKGVFVESNQGH
jgi:phosphoglycolate phosphatase-like HAD superfamily hydrolase